MEYNVMYSLPLQEITLQLYFPRYSSEFRSNIEYEQKNMRDGHHFECYSFFITKYSLSHLLTYYNI